MTEMLQTANTDLLESPTSRLCAATSVPPAGLSEFRNLVAHIALHPLRTPRWPHDAQVCELVSCLSLSH